MKQTTFASPARTGKGKVMRRIANTLNVAALLLGSGASLAHDTWLQALPDATPGEVMLALGTGNRFPVTEVAVATGNFAKSGCLTKDEAKEGSAPALSLVRYDGASTLLRTRSAGAAPMTCFIQLVAFDIELPPDKIPIYFKEIRPSAAALAAWAELRAKGLPFREHYIKSARIDLGANASSARTGAAMDALRTAPAGTLAVGTEATFQILRDGRPLPDFPVELINERSPVGLWHRTDADGRIRAKLPLPGRWLLRGTDLRLSAADPTRWESRFITYAFDVGRQ